MSYPSEDRKGRAISLFMTIYNLGGAFGGTVAFFSNLNNTSNGATSTTYILALIITGFGCLISLFILSPKDIIRQDGTLVTMESSLNTQLNSSNQNLWNGVVREVKQIWKVLLNPTFLYLFPMVRPSFLYFLEASRP